MKHIQTKEDWNTAPYEHYLLVTDSGGTRAYQIADNEALDLETLLAQVYPECTIDLQRPSIGGECCAAIIMDGRPPRSVVVWDSADFYLSMDEE